MKKLLLGLTIVFQATIAPCTIQSISSGDAVLGNRGSNLLTNGSFEADQGTYANLSYWATGTANNPTMSLTGWQASGLQDSYAVWGNTGTNLYNSGVIPDGENALYFGAQIMLPLNTMPIFATDGQVSWAQAPNITPKPGFGPVTLSQTLTGLNTSQSYLLDFWASGENANQAVWADGFFGLDITGENQIFLAAPGGTTGLGNSQRYYVVFQPTGSTITIQFTNWGHYIDNVNGFSSELCMDDVIVNPVPEPASIFAILIPAAYWIKKKRSR